MSKRITLENSFDCRKNDDFVLPWIYTDQRLAKLLLCAYVRSFEIIRFRSNHPISMQMIRLALVLPTANTNSKS